MTIALQWIFAAWIVFLGVGIAFRAIERSLLNRAADSRFSVSPGEAFASDQRVDVFAYVSIAAFVVTAIVFIVWFHRAYRRVRALGGEMRYSNGWAIGAWFIPIGNLWIPKKLANDIWWGSAPRDEGARPEHPALLAAWWSSWLAGGVIARFTGLGFGAYEDTDVNDALWANLMATVALAVTLLAAGFALFVVRQVGQRLTARPAATAAPVAADTPAPASPWTVPPSPGLAPPIATKRRRQPWRLIGATVAAVGLGVATVIIIAGATGGKAPTASQPLDTAPRVMPGPAPPDFGRHEASAGSFAIGVPNSWMSFDLSGPDVDRALGDVALTDPDIADSLRQQREAGALPSFMALETSPALATRPPGQLRVMVMPSEAFSLAEIAQGAEQAIGTQADVVGVVKRQRIALPSGNAQVLSFKQRLPDAPGNQTLATNVYLLVAEPSAYSVIVAGAPQDAEAHRAVFEAIIRSFEITASTAEEAPLSVPSIPSSISGPEYIAAGPDGNVWFTNYDDDTIGRITSSGETVTFEDQDGKIHEPEGMAAGPDGNLWFVSLDNNRIGRITPAGEITTFEDPQRRIREPEGITAGPDGALWFTSYENDRIGRIEPNGEIRFLEDPGNDVSGPDEITIGSDGNLWFTNSDDDSIGRITPSGDITTFHDREDRITGLEDIASGPDGNLWFTSYAVDKEDNPIEGLVGRITPSGDITIFEDLNSRITAPGDITAGPDGNLWFTSSDDDLIVRMTPDGETTVLQDPDGKVLGPEGITVGPDGNLWFTNYDDDSIGRIGPSGDITVFRGE